MSWTPVVGLMQNLLTLMHLHFISHQPPHSKRDLNQALGVLYMCFIFTKWPNLRVLLELSCLWIRIMQLLLQGVDVCLSLAEIYQCRLITYEPIKAPPIIGTVVFVSLIELDSIYTIQR